MWTTGGCHDNRACFCVTGGQLSLWHRGGREGGSETEEKEGVREDEIEESREERYDELEGREM